MNRYLFLAALLLSPLTTLATDVLISPVIIRADDAERSVLLNFTNKGANEVIYQIQAERWTQDTRGISIKEETGDLIFTPVVKIAPGSKRTVRVARQSNGLSQYILTLKQILPERKEGETGIRLPTEFRVPVLFEDSSGEVSLTVEQTGAGLLVSNSGKVAGHITSAGPQGGHAWKEGHLGWVLPSGTTLLPYQANGAPVELRINGKPVVAQVR